MAEEIGAFTGTAAARSSQFEDRYVDTADGALTRAGFAVRVRQSGRGTVVSVKSLSRSEGPGGAVRREELEGPADRTAGPLEWPASDARSLVLELAGDAPLLELVTIRQLRRKRVVRDGDTRVELSLDEVDVVSRSRVVDRFVELEAELVKGAEERLVALADIFSADPALAPASGSKLEAALAAVRSGGRHGHDAAEDRDGESPPRCARLPRAATAGRRVATKPTERPPGVRPSQQRCQSPWSSRRPPRTSSMRRPRRPLPVDTRLVVGKTPASPPRTMSPRPAARS